MKKRFRNLFKAQCMVMDTPVHGKQFKLAIMALKIFEKLPYDQRRLLVERLEQKGLNRGGNYETSSC